MSKIKAAYTGFKAVSKTAGKAYKIGRKTRHAKLKSRMGYDAAMGLRSKGMGVVKRSGISKASAEAMAKTFANTAKKYSVSGNAAAKAATKLQKRGGVVKAAAHLGRNQNKYIAGANTAVAGALFNKGRKRRSMTIKQRLALKKAQMASARKRRKG